MNKKGVIYKYGSKKKGYVRFTQSFWKTATFVTLRGVMTGIVGVVVIFVLFAVGPIIKEEFGHLYRQSQPGYIQKQTSQIVRADDISELQSIAEEYDVGTHFSIIIPKIEWGSDIATNMDQNDVSESEIGHFSVFHLKGSYFPGQSEEISLFVSTPGIDLNPSQNSRTYLVNKLDEEDIVILLFTDKRYYYQIVEAEIVDGPRMISDSVESEKLNILVDQSSFRKGYKLLSAVPVEIE